MLPWSRKLCRPNNHFPGWLFKLIIRLKKLINYKPNVVLWTYIRPNWIGQRRCLAAACLFHVTQRTVTPTKLKYLFGNSFRGAGNGYDLNAFHLIDLRDPLTHAERRLHCNSGCILRFLNCRPYLRLHEARYLSFGVTKPELKWCAALICDIFKNCDLFSRQNCLGAYRRLAELATSLSA